MGEFELIDHIKQAFAGSFEGLGDAGIVGIGDDCAVLPQDSGYQSVVSTDMLVEGTHFLVEDISAYQLGWKAAASNFSDIAAMGAQPVGSFLALALPQGSDFYEVGTGSGKPSGTGSGTWLQEFIQGYRDISVQYGFPLLGGDTTASRGGISICVTVVGKVRQGEAHLRSMARPGDLVCVTGTLGDSAAGLDIVLGRTRGVSNSAAGVEGTDSDESRYLVDRHYMPTPRVEMGRRIASVPGVHAMMDISDGVASDLRHILKASGVGSEIDCALLPLSPALRALYPGRATEFALCGGEDYELLFTASEDAVRKLTACVHDSCSVNSHDAAPVTVIGRILPEEEFRGIRYVNLPEGILPDNLRGFDHFL